MRRGCGSEDDMADRHEAMDSKSSTDEPSDPARLDAQQQQPIIHKRRSNTPARFRRTCLRGAHALLLISLLTSTAVASAPPASAQAVEKTAFYRLYNPGNGDHLYTTSAVERSSALQGGYVDEGVAAYVHTTSEVSGTAPLYRLYNAGNGDHFYTTSSPERDAAILGGYQSEGIAAHVYLEPHNGTSALYRLYNPGNGDHLYTMSAVERSNALMHGYLSEGVQAYVFPETDLAERAPCISTLKTFPDESADYVRIRMEFRFCDDFDPNTVRGSAYEHDLKLFSGADVGARTEGSCFPTDLEHFWANRYDGISYETNLPKPYLDTALRDPCNVMDLTVGTFVPERLLVDKQYFIELRVRRGKGTASPFQLTSTFLKKLPLPKPCTSPYCVSIPGFDKQPFPSAQLIGNPSGSSHTLPTCGWKRDVANNYSVKMCG